jgi:putative transposase
MLPLQPDTSYHIFNHANGFENIFRKEENFHFFLEKYRLYISPIAETYAYCLMPNHFHLVVRIRKRAAIEELIRNKNKTNFSKVSNLEGSVNLPIQEYNKTECINFGKVEDSEIEKYLSKQFANLFSCYTQSFNKVYNRMGSLFIKNFKREPILDKAYFLKVIVYTHRNPIHHGFCKLFDDWEFSSYTEITEGFSDTIELVKLLKIVGNLESFKELHQQGLENLNQPELYEMPPIND